MHLRKELTRRFCVSILNFQFSIKYDLGQDKKNRVLLAPY
jgi:hypothetical protein